MSGCSCSVTIRVLESAQIRGEASLSILINDDLIRSAAATLSGHCKSGTMLRTVQLEL